MPLEMPDRDNTFVLKVGEAADRVNRPASVFDTTPVKKKKKKKRGCWGIREPALFCILSVHDLRVWLLPQVENGGEYILETIDSLQKNSWVADIQDCIDPG